MSWVLEEAGKAEAAFIVPEIVGKQRPRVTVRGRHASAYTPRKTRVFEAQVRKAWIEQVGGKWAEFHGAVTVTVTFERELAKSNPKYWAGRCDTGKPDIDNAVKAILDALNGLAYADDCEITRMDAVKLPRVPNGSGNSIHIEITYYTERHEK